MPPSKFSRRETFSPARSIVAMTSALRDIHIDYETMLIESIATDTTAYCTKPHWATSVLLPVRAGRSTKYLTPGQRVIVRWEDGYGQRRFIDAGSRLGKLGDDETPQSTLDWVCEGADWERRSSYTEAAWDYAESEVLPGLAELCGDPEVAFIRFYQGITACFTPRYFVEDFREDPEEELPSGYYEDADAPEGYIAAGPAVNIRVPDFPEFIWRHNLREYITEEGIDWSTFRGDSLCISTTGEVVLGWFEEHEIEGILSPRDRASVFYGGPDVVLGLRKTVAFTLPRREGADVVLCGDQICLPLQAYLGGDYLGCCQLSGEDIEPENVELTGGNTGLIGQVWDTTPLGHQLHAALADGTRVYLQDGSGGTYGVDPAEREISWTYSGDKYLLPLLVDSGRLLCAYEERDYITLTDRFEDLEWDGSYTETDRIELAAGHSLRAGYVHLSTASGDELIALQLDGTEEISPLLGEIEEYRATVGGPQFSGPGPLPEGGPGSTPPIESDPALAYRWLTGFGALPWLDHVALAFGPGLDVGEEPTPGDVSPYSETNSNGATSYPEAGMIRGSLGSVPADAGPCGYIDNTENGRTWLATFVGNATSWIEAMVRVPYRLAETRAVSTDWMRKIFMRLEWYGLTADSHAGVGPIHTVSGEPANETPPTGGLAELDAAWHESPSGFVSEEYPDGLDEEPAGCWVTGAEPSTFALAYQSIWRNTQTSDARYRTSPPEHAVGPLASGLGIFVSPGDKGGGNPPFRARRLSTFEYLWDWEPDPVVTGEVFIGNVWIDAAGVHINWSDGVGDHSVILDAEDGAVIAEPALPGDMIDQVFDGTNVHDAAGRWTI